MPIFAEYEQKERGTFDFPAELYYVGCQHPRYEMPFHWHIECEFIVVHQGGLKLLLDSEVSELKPGLSAFIPGGTIHGCYPEGRHTIYECIVLELEHFLHELPVGNERFKKELDSGFSIRRIFSHESTAGRLIEELFSELNRREAGYEFMTTGLLWSFIGTVLREKAYQPGRQGGYNTERTRSIKQALQKIRDEYTQPITLESLSAEVNMSPKYFCRVFRELTGRTPIEYLNRYRIERAAESVYGTSESITDIALHCGFNDPSYFSRIFRKYKGISPVELRRQRHIHSARYAQASTDEAALEDRKACGVRTE